MASASMTNMRISSEKRKKPMQSLIAEKVLIRKDVRKDKMQSATPKRMQRVNKNILTKIRKETIL